MNKTQCPHCFKVYNITEKQYQASDGIVMCGACRHEFYASLIEETIELSPSSKDNETEPLKERLRPVNYSFDESLDSEISIRFDDSDSENVVADDEFENGLAAESSPHTPTIPHGGPELEEPQRGKEPQRNKKPQKEKESLLLTDLADERSDDTDNASNVPSAVSFEEAMSQTDVNLINEVDQLIEEKILTAPIAAQVADQIEELSTNELDDSPSNDKPRRKKRKPSSKTKKRTQEAEPDQGKFEIKGEKISIVRSFIITPLLSLLATALILSLLYQLWLKQMIMWPDKPIVQDAIQPLATPIKEKLTTYNVVLPERRNLNGLQLVAADVEAHATRSSTILLRVSLINRAKIAQALPSLELSLTDADGRLVSRRSLNPESYLHNNRTANSIGIKELKRVTIELLAFPKQATGYELRILGESAQ